MSPCASLSAHHLRLETGSPIMSTRLILLTSDSKINRVDMIGLPVSRRRWCALRLAHGDIRGQRLGRTVTRSLQSEMRKFARSPTEVWHAESCAVVAIHGRNHYRPRHDP